MPAPISPTLALLDAATRPYRDSGRFHYYFARGKLGRDPAFFALLRQGLIPDHVRLLDLGCGQFLLAALLFAARAQFDRGTWPADWTPAPIPGSFHGIELRANVVAAGQAALGDRVTLRRGDICETEFPASDVVVILDVLHYIDAASQERVLAKVAACLHAGGRLLLRVGDAAAGWSFLVTRMTDQLITMARGAVWPSFHCRSLSEWIALLERFGFVVRPEPMNQGTPFANVMLIAHKKG